MEGYIDVTFVTLAGRSARPFNIYFRVTWPGGKEGSVQPGARKN